MAYRAPRFVLHALLCLIALGGAAYADQAVTSPLARTAVFDIEAQPLSSALIEFSRQADVQVLTPASRVQKLKTRGVHGRMTVSEALSELLQGTRLRYHLAGTNIIGIDAQSRTTANPSRIGNEPLALAQSPTNMGQERQGASNDTAPSSGAPLTDGETEELQQIVVTADKVKEPLLDVPMSLSAITGTELRRSHSFRLQDFMAQVPGVSLLDYGGLGTQIVIRGITSGSVPINSAVATYIDETPFTSEGPFAGSYFLTPDLDTFDMRRIEVLRGPQGTLYGANSLGGVVRYITNPPKLSAVRATVEAGLSSVYNGSVGHDVHAMVNIPLLQHAALRVVGYTNYYPGFIDDPARGLTDTNGSHYSGGRASLLYEPVSGLSIRLNALYQDISWNDYPNEDVRQGTLAPLFGSLNENELINNSGSKIVKLYNATIRWNTSIAKLMSATSYYSLSASARYEYPTLNSVVSGIFGSAYPGAAVSFDEPIDAFTEEIRASSAARGPLHWIAGLYFTNEHAREGENLLPITTNHVIDYGFSPALGLFLIPVQYKEGAAYLNVDYDILHNLDVAAGARYSENHQTFHETGVGVFAGGVSYGNKSSQHVATYSADLRWHPTPGQMLYARYSEGFAPGGPNDSFSGSTLPSTYSSSETRNYEAGLKGRYLRDRLVVEVSGFHIVWSGIQLQAVINGFGGIVNGGVADSNGFDWNVALSPIAGLNFSVDGAYTDAYLTQDTPASVNGHSGDRLPGVPLWSGAVNVHYQHAISADYSGFAAVSWQYSGGRFADFISPGPRQEMPAYRLTNLRLGVRAATWSATLYVKNLTNVVAINYVQPETLSGGMGLQDATLYTPRTIGGMVTYHFR